MEKYSLIIFDCDGVLVDSEYLSARVLVETFAAIGVAIDLAFVFDNFLGHSFSEAAAQYAKLHGKCVPETFEADYRARLLDKFSTDLRPMPFIGNVLDELSVPCCLATGSSPVRVTKSLEITGLAARFTDRVFATSMVARGKPAPDVFLHTAKAMGVAPAQCLVVEDSATGIVAAHAAGMAVWQFTGGSHFQHGYNHTGSSHLVDRTFDRMDRFFDGAPDLRRRP